VRRRELSCTLNGGEFAPGAARRVLERFAGDDLDERRLRDARLLVSELVTNSVRHAGAGPGTTIELHLWFSDEGQLHVDVCDDGDGFDPSIVNRTAAAARIGGRGLHLMDLLAEQWGVANNGRSVVWFELPAA